MDKLVIKGGNPLKGEVTVSGAKNAAVAIIPATIVVAGVCRIENIPSISDVDIILRILAQMGADVKLINKNCVEIDTSRINCSVADYDLVKKMRGSYYLMGALLSRFSKASVAMPGGCDLGPRPIDQHLKGFEALGAKIDVKYGIMNARAEHLKGASVYLDVVSVGATINIMLAATRAEGTTIIENAAKEPHIVDLANFLNSMGAQISGAGTDSIKIRGVKTMHGGTYTIIPDQIEAGTFMVAAAATKGSVLIKNVIPKHLESITAKLMEMGVEVEEYDEAVYVTRTKPISKVNIKTLPYPGFPTDMNPQAAVLLCLAEEGSSVISESVWDNRFRYTDELKRMGARINVDGRVAVIDGVGKFTGAKVKACDLRAGAAMIIAGLCASGTTEIEDISHIERGYEDVVSKFRSLGADIQKVIVPKSPPYEKAL
ncbi:MAG: UDP-N-acetylglucosamine 1-carboxyvinyltransferase [Clostridia bacterium]|nr:UDP-N-acetylglucosamine 1-carboxyvinyltransferase [Clostridia bacterium]